MYAMRKSILFVTIVLFICNNAISQNPQTKRVLFIGNSYTYVNDLPQMLADVAQSLGDSVYFESSTPGGYTFQQHTTDATTLSKINSGNWDYVVLQEQSQRPSFPQSQVEQEVFPYARILDSIINLANPCVETVFYMTWGRKNGDASNCQYWPPVCTYEGMDALLRERYMVMADSNKAIVSPVGAVWNYLRKNNPTIELYSSDESHPSVAGTYAAALSFYSVIFQKDPSQSPFTAQLNLYESDNVKNAVKAVAYDSLSYWNVGKYQPQAIYCFVITGNRVSFNNHSQNADSYLWEFGDGSTSALDNPTHTYTANGTYTVKLIASKCPLADTNTQTVIIIGVGVEEEGTSLFRIYPNPVKDLLNIATSKELGQEIEISVFDEKGKKLMQEPAQCFSEGLFKINVSSLLSGVYILQIRSIRDEIYKVFRFVKP